MRGGRKVTPQLKHYTIIARAVEEGAAMGWRRAFKYTDTPDDETVIMSIAAEIMNALDEIIRWE